MLHQHENSVMSNSDDELFNSFNETVNSWNLKDSLYELNSPKKNTWANYPIWSNFLDNENINKHWSITPTNANSSPNNTITSINDDWKTKFDDCPVFESLESNSDFKSNEESKSVSNSDQIIDEKTLMMNMINSTANWGRSPIDQTTPWYLNGSNTNENKNVSDSIVWESEPPSGTGIWDKHYASAAISTQRKRENSAETLAPNPTWNDNNDSLSCDLNQTVTASLQNNQNQSTLPNGKDGNYWNKQINGLTNNFSNLLACNKTAFNNQQNSNNFLSKPHIQSINNTTTNYQMNGINYDRLTAGSSSSNNNNFNNNKSSRLVSLNSMFQLNDENSLSFNGISNVPVTSTPTNIIIASTSKQQQQQHSQGKQFRSGGPPQSSLFNTQNALKNHHQFHNNTNRNQNAPSSSAPIINLQTSNKLNQKMSHNNDNSNTFLTMPPLLQNYHHPSFNTTQQHQMNNNTSINGNNNYPVQSHHQLNGIGSFRADITKQFISLGYNKDDVQGSLINSNMDVERTIAELNEIYPNLTYKAIEHFASIFNGHQQPSQMKPFSHVNGPIGSNDWKFQKTMRKPFGSVDKESSFIIGSEKSIIGSKLLSSCQNNNGYPTANGNNSTSGIFPYSNYPLNVSKNHINTNSANHNISNNNNISNCKSQGVAFPTNTSLLVQNPPPCQPTTPPTLAHNMKNLTSNNNNDSLSASPNSSSSNDFNNGLLHRHRGDTNNSTIQNGLLMSKSLVYNLMNHQSQQHMQPAQSSHHNHQLHHQYQNNNGQSIIGLQQQQEAWLNGSNPNSNSIAKMKK